MEGKYIPAFSFDFLTPAYDFILDILGFGTAQREKIVKLLNLHANEKLLDIGCGTGSLLLVAKKKYPNVEMIGLDIDKKVLQIARVKFDKNKVNIKTVNASASELPFPDSSFNTVVSTLIFHHLPTDIKRKCLKEVSRILKPHGRFLLVDFGKLNWPLKIFYYLEVIFRIPEARTAKDNVEGMLPVLLKETGFEYKEVAPRYRGVEYLLSKNNV